MLCLLWEQKCPSHPVWGIRFPKAVPKAREFEGSMQKDCTLLMLCLESEEPLFQFHCFSLMPPMFPLNWDHRGLYLALVSLIYCIDDIAVCSCGLLLLFNHYCIWMADQQLFFCLDGGPQDLSIMVLHHLRWFLIRTYTAPIDKHHLNIRDHAIIQRKLEHLWALGDHGREKLSFNRKKASTEPGSRRGGAIWPSRHISYGFMDFKIKSQLFKYTFSRDMARVKNMTYLRLKKAVSGYIELFCVYLVAQVIFV